RKTNDIIVAAITSNITQKDYAVFISNKDLKTGKLKVNSCIRVNKIYTLSQNIVIKKFGSVKNYILEEVKAKLKELLF
ncbi:MAG: mRNA interferase MazF, partial [Thermosediminibacterales bacterium]|nr:mRNA interferase MazF [Thermosediminibacterales bacterium]MDK2835591.1 mRNA interferase MazF [Thermosediminibacterales bacterium]